MTLAPNNVTGPELSLESDSGLTGPLVLSFPAMTSVNVDLPAIYRGMAGPPGPAYGDDLPSFSLVFENGLV